ncbi:MAG: DUF1295 domain-containing protein, partial [Pseudomonadota bacterium]
MTALSLIGLNLLVVGLVVLGLWLLSLRLKDVSFVDAFWPTGFGVVAWTTFLAVDVEHSRATLLLGFTSLWSLRLGIYLLSRWLSEPHEDKRYQAMRRNRPHFKWQSIHDDQRTLEAEDDIDALPFERRPGAAHRLIPFV